MQLMLNAVHELCTDYFIKVNEKGKVVFKKPNGKSEYAAKPECSFNSTHIRIYNKPAPVATASPRSIRFAEQ
ncbi:hypothetical protein [Paenibacillus sp. MMS20-IR301]|uniref:hypothetical protein n=1 Tax=Paenibacillus sp. MMS20-IR301 TaxID=2895946 RepID=UPI0028E79FDD|nr:hypothetical protein [Paenibacillus sp. MMS20-IR301]WNS42020.1 hypothetical protein LOS79_23845 [Paenibacillus sp. MMS20-IR301]